MMVVNPLNMFFDGKALLLIGLEFLSSLSFFTLGLVALYYIMFRLGGRSSEFLSKFLERESGHPSIFLFLFTASLILGTMVYFTIDLRDFGQQNHDLHFPVSIEVSLIFLMFFKVLSILEKADFSKNLGIITNGFLSLNPVETNKSLVNLVNGIIYVSPVAIMVNLMAQKTNPFSLQNVTSWDLSIFGLLLFWSAISHVILIAVEHLVNEMKKHSKS